MNTIKLGFVPVIIIDNTVVVARPGVVVGGPALAIGRMALGDDAWLQAAAARMDIGGVEYIVDERDGRLMYYDINALSNFVADAPRILGFDPHARLVDYLEEEARGCATVTGSLCSAAG